MPIAQSRTRFLTDMSSPAPEISTGMDEIGPYWTDEQTIAFLVSIQRRGSMASLPQGVISYINPYLWEPSNLPDGIWYFVDSEAPKQQPAAFGFWEAKGDPCLIYPDSDSDSDSDSCSVIGLRTTLEFHQGLPPNSKLTDWVMQDYTLSHRGSIQAAKGVGSLCQVFLSDRQCESKKPDQHPANADNEHGKPLKTKLHANLLHADCFSEGGFLELDDLDDPQSSSSSSSGNSSCVTPSSDVYFDSDALLQELGTNLSANKFTISRTNDMVLTVTTQGIAGNRNTAEPVKVKDSKTKPPPELYDAGASTSRQMPRASKGKKAYHGKTIKKFLCFL